MGMKEKGGIEIRWIGICASDIFNVDIYVYLIFNWCKWL